MKEISWRYQSLQRMQSSQSVRSSRKGKKMKAVAYKKASPIDHPESLLNVEAPIPHATRRDLLVELQAVSVNPVDVKVRTTVAPNGDEYKILGRNASGVDKEVGPEASYSSPETKCTTLAPLHVPAQTLSFILSTSTSSARDRRVLALRMQPLCR